MDLPFIVRNYAGLIAARCVERIPALLPPLRRSRSRLKPFIATRLRGERLPQVTTQDIGPFRMQLRLGDDVQRQIYLGLYENTEIAMCRPLVRAGGTCIDVGANVGWFSLHFAAWVGSSGRVIACEADPVVASELRVNSDLNDFEGVIEIVDAAISDTCGSLTFTRSPREHSGWGSILAQRGNHGGESISILATTLDSLVKSRNIRDVDLLKVDVEGFEFAVLQGAADSLRAKVFGNILIEWEGIGQTGRGRTIAEMHDIFASNGYCANSATIRLLQDFRSGEIDARSAFANLLYSRSHQPT